MANHREFGVRNIFWGIGLIFTLLVVFRFFSCVTSPPEKVMQRTVVQLPPEKRKWIYCWKRQTSENYPNAANQDTNEFCEGEAVISQADDVHFDFTVSYRDHYQPYKALYEWNKVKGLEYGTWRQPSPKHHGEWSLEKSGNHLYVGYEITRNVNGKIIDRAQIELREVKSD